MPLIFRIGKLALVSNSPVSVQKVCHCVCHLFLLLVQLSNSELALVNIEWVNNDGMTLIKILIDSRGTKYTVELSGEIFRCLTEDYLNEFVSIVQTFLSNSPVKIERSMVASTVSAFSLV